MEKSSLHDAVVQIRQAVDCNTNNYPYFFIIGAGVSHPEIPLANDIICHCENKAENDYKDSLQKPSISDSDATPMEKYSYWMKNAYPDAKSRQKYIESLITGKPLSLANLRLAHILGSRKLARIVVTPNFDDHLSRSLNLFGIQHVICDHPATTARVSLNPAAPITILHVHGTYWFYDCCNLCSEITARAGNHPESQSSDSPNQGEQVTSSMSQVLGNILHESSPIVIGYSGWESDVIMQVLKLRLESAIPHNVYWFCHSQGDAESLPRWLTSNKSVIIIAPVGRRKTGISAITEYGVQTVIGVPDQETQEQTQNTALMVFDEILRQFGMVIPTLVDDPLGMFITSLESSINAEQRGQDAIYKFDNVITDIRRARELLLREKAESSKSDLDTVRRCMQQANYADALNLLSKIDPSLLKPEIEEICKWIGVTVSSHKLTDEETIGTCDKACKIFDDLSRTKISQEQEIHIQMGQLGTMAVKAFHYRILGRRKDAVAVYDSILCRFGAARAPQILFHLGQAMADKGDILLYHLEREDEAGELYDEMMKRFVASNKLEPGASVVLSRRFARFLIAWGSKLAPKDAISKYDEVVKRFGSSKVWWLRDQVATALIRKGGALCALKKPQEAIDAYEEVVQRFLGDREAVLRQQVAMALVNKGITLWEVNRPDSAIAAYEEVMRRFGDAPEVALREQVAVSLVNKAIALQRMSKLQEAIAAYEGVLGRFGDAPEPELCQLVAMALWNQGILLCAVGNPNEATLRLKDSLARIRVVPSVQKIQFSHWAVADKPVLNTLLAKYSAADYLELQQVARELIRFLEADHGSGGPTSKGHLAFRVA